MVLEWTGMEVAPLLQWLHAGIREQRFAVELLGTWHVRAAFKTMPVMIDSKDACGIAQLMQMGWVRPVHFKSLTAQVMGRCGPSAINLRTIDAERTERAVPIVRYRKKLTISCDVLRRH